MDRGDTGKVRSSGLMSLHSGLCLFAQAGTRLGLGGPVLRLLARRVLLREPQSFRRYQPTEHDLIVATFAKSGTNWALQMGHQIAHRGQGDFGHIHDVVAWPEGPFSFIVPLDDPTPQRSSPTGKRVIKTHLGTAAVPYNPAATYLTVVRDPKEVLVSAYYFMLGQFGLLDRISPEQWVDLATSDDLFPQYWAQHTAGFWSWRDRPNVLVRLFGDVKADLPGTIDDIATLLGVALTEQERAEVLEKSSFRWMKARDHKFTPPRSPLVPADQHPSMMRKGKTGAAQEMLDASAMSHLDDACRAALSRLGSDFPFDDAFG